MLLIFAVLRYFGLVNVPLDVDVTCEKEKEIGTDLIVCM